MKDNKNCKEDETEFINTEELRNVLKENNKKKNQKECFLKRLFKKKGKGE